MLLRYELTYSLRFYTSSAKKEYVPYPYPQKHGNHYGVKILSFTTQLKVWTNGKMEINVSMFDSDSILEKNIEFVLYIK